MLSKEQLEKIDILAKKIAKSTGKDVVFVKEILMTTCLLSDNNRVCNGRKFNTRKR